MSSVINNINNNNVILIKRCAVPSACDQRLDPPSPEARSMTSRDAEGGTGHSDPVLLQRLGGGGEPGAGGRFRFARWSVARLGCGGVSVKTFFVFISFDLVLYSLY